MEREKEGGPREGLRVRFSEDRTNQYSTQYYSQSPRDREREQEVYDSRSAPPIQPPPPPVQPPPCRPSFLQMESTPQSSYIPQYTVPTAPAQTHEAMEEARAGVGGSLGLMVLPPPAPSIDADDEFVFADPLPPPLQFANGKKERIQEFPRQHQQLSQRSANVSPPPPPPLPSTKASNATQPSPQGGDSAASSLTSYDSEVANLTQSALSPSYPSPQIFPPYSTSTTTTISTAALPATSLHRPQPMSHSHPYYSSSNDSSVGGHTAAQDRGSATLTTTMTYATTTMTASAAASTTTSPSSSDYSMTMAGLKAGLSIEGKAADHTHNPTIIPKSGDWQDAVVDSGIEELDSHSSSDHHLEMLGLSGLRGERGGDGRGGEAEKVGEHQDPCTTYSGGQTFEVHSARLANPVFPKMTHYKEGGGRGPPVALRRQNSTNPAPLQLQRQSNPEDTRFDGALTDERKHKQSQSKMEDGFSSALAACLERPMDTPSVGWDEVGEHDLGGGRMQRDGMVLEGRRFHSPLSGVKASIINELSSKLQQMSSMKSMDDWSQTPKSPTMHRFVCFHQL